MSDNKFGDVTLVDATAQDPPPTSKVETTKEEKADMPRTEYNTTTSKDKLR